MADERIPTSRLGRLARLAAMGTRAGAGRALAALGAPGSEARVAQAAADALGTMRGLALKLGQMASYVDGAVPEEHREAYERAMKSLRDAAPTMPADAAARVVEAELGAPPERLFAEWSEQPFASASIGQVHRARLADGRHVAVKVQYEGVARAVAADLSNASMLSALLGPLGARFAVKDQLAEMRARFNEELDYRHEAEQQRRFAAIFEGHHRVGIPEVVTDTSARRVLTSELVSGIDFEAACARPAAERVAWAETLWTFVFQSLLCHGLFNADPHPGNYVFRDDVPGGVWFLDFGCTRPMRAEKLALVREAHRSASSGDAAGLVRAAAEMLELLPGSEQERLGREYIVLCFAPILAEGPYHVTRDYTRTLYQEMQANALAMLKGRRAEFAPLPAEWLFFNRLQLGFYSVLARLDVPVDYGAIERRLLAATDSGGTCRAVARTPGARAGDAPSPPE